MILPQASLRPIWQLPPSNTDNVTRGPAVETLARVGDLPAQDFVAAADVSKILRDHKRRLRSSGGRRVDLGIEGVLKQVDSTKFMTQVKALSALGPRNVAELSRHPDNGNARTVTWLSEQFKGMGYAVHTHDYAEHRYGAESNVIAEKRGTTHPNEVVLVIAHLDDVGHEHAGADDNASGVAAMLEMARILAPMESGRTIRFVAANGEEGLIAQHALDFVQPRRPSFAEGGLRGSTAYVGALKQAGTLKQVKQVIAMDMVASNPGNNIVDLETERRFAPLAQWYAQQARTYTTLEPKLVFSAWGSDHVPFLRENVPTVLTIEHWETKTPCYHRPCDKPESLKASYATEIIKLNLAVVLLKADVKPSAR